MRDRDARGSRADLGTRYGPRCPWSWRSLGHRLRPSVREPYRCEIPFAGSSGLSDRRLGRRRGRRPLGPRIRLCTLERCLPPRRPPPSPTAGPCSRSSGWRSSWSFSTRPSSTSRCRRRSSDLGFSTENRQWVVTAYALAFGSLLLVGGKIGDLFGRKWTFIGGLIGFSAASFLGGLAPSFGVLVVARALQGAFGALLAPSALSLLTVTFADSPERAKAFGIFSAVATAGASVGLLLGGLLTDVLSWRWCLYVNLLIAIPAVFFALRLHRQRGAPAAAAHRLRRRRARVHRPVRDRLRVLQGRDGRLAGTRDDRLARGGRRAAHRVRVHRSSASTSRCCRCTSSGTAPAAAPTPRSPSPARASSPSSCSSRSSCSRTSAIRR